MRTVQSWTNRRGNRTVTHVAFREDDSCVGDPAASENRAVPRHIAFARRKQDCHTKLSIQNKRFQAGWDECYLAELLFTPPHANAVAAPSGDGDSSGA